MQYPTEGKLLLSDGGGMKGAWMWGVRTRLCQLGLPADYFDVELSSSAGTFNSAFALAGQFEEGKRCWLHHMPLGFWKPLSNDMAFLERLLTEIEPLDYWGFPQKKTKVFVALSDPETLRSVILSLNHARDPIQLLVASAAAQYFSGPRKVDGKLYFDAGLTNQPPLDHVPQFKPREVWVLMAKPYGHRIKGLEAAVLKLAGLVYCLQDLKGGRLLLNCPSRRNKTLEAIENNPRFKIIRPAEPLIPTRCKDRAAALAEYKKGLLAAEEFARNEHW